MVNVASFLSVFVGVSACGSKSTYSVDKALHVRLVLVLFGIGSNGFRGVIEVHQSFLFAQ